MSKRATFTRVVSKLIWQDQSLVLLLGDIGVWSFRDTFHVNPGRCFNLGIAEQASVGMAAGLAMNGLFPIFSTIESFLLRRAYEFLRLDFGEQRLPGLFIGIGGANEYAKLGPTHQCPEGLALAKRIPGMQLYAPNDDQEVEEAITEAVRRRELAYVRLEESP